MKKQGKIKAAAKQGRTLTKVHKVAEVKADEAKARGLNVPSPPAIPVEVPKGYR